MPDLRAAPFRKGEIPCISIQSISSASWPYRPCRSFLFLPSCLPKKSPGTPARIGRHPPIAPIIQAMKSESRKKSTIPPGAKTQTAPEGIPGAEAQPITMIIVPYPSKRDGWKTEEAKKSFPDGKKTSQHVIGRAELTGIGPIGSGVPDTVSHLHPKIGLGRKCQGFLFRTDF